MTNSICRLRLTHYICMITHLSSMALRIINILLAAVFILFAYWQVNDPDPHIWVPIYLLTATFLGFAAFRKYAKIPTLLALGAGLIGLGLYIPEVSEWVQAGMPSITGKMKAETQYIEWMREFLGLLLCVLAVGYVWMQQRKLARRI